MSRRYLIEKDGERQNVTSLEGYEGWTVVDDDCDLPPSDHCEYDPTAPKGKRWKEDKAKREKHERRIRYKEMHRDELVDELMAEIRKLEARIEKLEKKA